MDKLKYKKVNHPTGAIQTGLSGILRTSDGTIQLYPFEAVF